MMTFEKIKKLIAKSGINVIQAKVKKIYETELGGLEVAMPKAIRFSFLQQTKGFSLNNHSFVHLL